MNPTAAPSGAPPRHATGSQPYVHSYPHDPHGHGAASEQEWKRAAAAANYQLQQQFFQASLQQAVNPMVKRVEDALNRQTSTLRDDTSGLQVLLEAVKQQIAEQRKQAEDGSAALRKEMESLNKQLEAIQKETKDELEAIRDQLRTTDSESSNASFTKKAMEDTLQHILLVLDDERTTKKGLLERSELALSQLQDIVAQQEKVFAFGKAGIQTRSSARKARDTMLQNMIHYLPEDGPSRGGRNAHPQHKVTKSRTRK